MGKWDNYFIEPEPDVFVDGINESAGYFSYFPTEADARAFAAELPQPSRSEISAPDDDSDPHWTALVFGPWRSRRKAVQELRPLAKNHRGSTPEPEDFRPEFRAAEREAFGP
jgi:hypothetical protein